jgi:hypothetical protein
MKFFFDNNLGRQLPEGLKAFGEDACHLQDYFSPDTNDEDWLKYIGEHGWFLITVDKRIRRRPLERQALISGKVGAFFLLGKSMSRWNYVTQIIRSWEKIKQIAERETPPFAYQVDRHGTSVDKIPLR